jgi:ribokinase
MPVRNLDEARKCAQQLLDNGVRRVIVTLGANGALCAGPESAQHVAAFPVQAFDTTGAGDAFIGGLAYFLATGCEESEAISRANLYAALSTLGVGTQKSFVTLERFQAEWAARHSLNVTPL